MTHRIKARRGEAPATFERLAALETDECVLWPFSLFTSGGYGHLSINRRAQRVHCLVAERRLGTKPPGMEVAHSCGVAACLNYRHLRWATHTENIADRNIHGTSNRGERNGGAKLTAECVIEIRRIAAENPGLKAREIGMRYDVTSHTITAILRRDRWAWLD